MGVGNNLFVVGNVLAISGSSSGANGIYSITATFIQVIGTIMASRFANGVLSSSATAINLFSGPFISNQFGACAVQCFRMNLIPTSGSEYKFYDNSTSGSLSVAGQPYSLYTVGVAGDCPDESDVRDGVVYANSTQTGTLTVPPANAVSVGVPVDNTVGTAWLDPQLFADLNAAQIAGLLNGL
jgi:hypothetical protein